jgi:hypothetical protein
MVHGKLLVSAAALGILAGVPDLFGARGDAAQGIAAEVPPGEWRSAPEYVRLFTPLRAHTESYRAYISPRDVSDVIRQLENDPLLLHPPGAWTPTALLSSEAFGLSGSYDRAKLARLYGARRALVARGPRGDGGRPTQAWTLISPYPDRNLERLEPGTLLIVLNLISP